MRTEHIQYTCRYIQQTGYTGTVHVNGTVFAEMTDKSACIVQPRYGIDIFDRGIFHGSIHHTAAKAAGTAGMTYFTENTFRR